MTEETTPPIDMRQSEYLKIGRNVIFNANNHGSNGVLVVVSGVAGDRLSLLEAKMDDGCLVYHVVSKSGSRTSSEGDLVMENRNNYEQSRIPPGFRGYESGVNLLKNAGKLSPEDYRAALEKHQLLMKRRG